MTTDTEPVSATELTTTESVKVEPVPKTASSITKSPVLPELKISTTAVPIPTVSIVFTQKIYPTTKNQPIFKPEIEIPSFGKDHLDFGFDGTKSGKNVKELNGQDALSRYLDLVKRRNRGDVSETDSTEKSENSADTVKFDEPKGVEKPKNPKKLKKPKKSKKPNKPKNLKKNPKKNRRNKKKNNKSVSEKSILIKTKAETATITTHSPVVKPENSSASVLITTTTIIPTSSLKIQPKQNAVRTENMINANNEWNAASLEKTIDVIKPEGSILIGKPLENTEFHDGIIDNFDVKTELFDILKSIDEPVIPNTTTEVVTRISKTTNQLSFAESTTTQSPQFADSTNKPSEPFISASTILKPAPTTEKLPVELGVESEINIEDIFKQELAEFQNEFPADFFVTTQQNTEIKIEKVEEPEILKLEKVDDLVKSKLPELLQILQETKPETTTNFEIKTTPGLTTKISSTTATTTSTIATTTKTIPLTTSTVPLKSTTTTEEIPREIHMLKQILKVEKGSNKIVMKNPVKTFENYSKTPQNPSKASKNPSKNLKNPQNPSNPSKSSQSSAISKYYSQRNVICPSYTQLSKQLHTSITIKNYRIVASNNSVKFNVGCRKHYVSSEAELNAHEKQLLCQNGNTEQHSQQIRNLYGVIGSYRCYYDECVYFNKCKNGGKCVHKFISGNRMSTSCDCAGTGFEGDYCEKDVDECGSDEHDCQDSEVCVNKIGRYECKCAVGYLSFEGVCAKSLCQENPCDHDCQQDLAEEFTCSCKKGYQLDSNGLKCDLIQKPGKKHFGKPKLCSFRNQQKNCYCKAGFERKIATKNPSANHKNNPGNHPGNHPGKPAQQFFCEDIDECENAEKICRLPSHVCVNTLGRYKCECRDGYEVDKSSSKCVLKDFCKVERWDESRNYAPKCLNNGTCSNDWENKMAKCECAYGYGGRFCEKKMNLCLRKNADEILDTPISQLNNLVKTTKIGTTSCGNGYRFVFSQMLGFGPKHSEKNSFWAEKGHFMSFLGRKRSF